MFSNDWFVLQGPVLFAPFYFYTVVCTGNMYINGFYSTEYVDPFSMFAPLVYIGSVEEIVWL